MTTQKKISRSGRPGTQDQSQGAKLNISPRAPVLFGMMMFILLFVAGGAWAYFANLSGAVIAQGSVAVPGKPKTIQHLDGGIVSKIAISEGDSVSKGDVLIQLDDTLLNANMNIYQNRLRDAHANQARLRAERDGAEKISWQGDVLEILNIKQDEAIKRGQEKLFEARLETRLGQVAQLKEKIAQLKNQISGIKALQTSKKRQIELMEDELAGVRKLSKQGLALKSRLVSLERQHEDLVGQIAEHDAELARIQNAIGEAKIQILQIDREFRQSVLTELRQIEREVNDLTQQLLATSEQLKRITIRSPISGIVHQLSVFTIGGILSPGAPVMQIIPQENKFEVEANIQPQFIDELHAGQAATLRFSAFNQRTTPDLNGVVKTISANIVVNKQTGQSFYKLDIQIPDDELTRLGNQTLLPGMPVEVFIQTRQRTALNYLVKPLLDQIKRAGREE